MRLLVILYRLGPLALAFRRDARRWLLFGAPARRTADDHERRARRLVEQLAALGPTFVKLAQLFAGRADLLAQRWWPPTSAPPSASSASSSGGGRTRT